MSAAARIRTSRARRRRSRAGLRRRRHRHQVRALRGRRRDARPRTAVRRRAAGSDTVEQVLDLVAAHGRRLPQRLPPHPAARRRPARPRSRRRRHGGRRALRQSRLADAPFRSLAESRLGLPVAFSHDVARRRRGRAAARRGTAVPGRRRAGRSAPGIAGALFVDGRPYSGGGFAGEIGHSIVVPGGRECVCGGRGHLESVASAGAIARLLHRADRHAMSRAPARCSPTRRRATATRSSSGTRRSGRSRSGISQLVAILAPEAVVIGGGLAAGRRRVLRAARGRSSTGCSRFHRRPLLIPAQLGEDAGLLGAALRAARPRSRRAARHDPHGHPEPRARPDLVGRRGSSRAGATGCRPGRSRAGGKGLNVARVLHAQGLPRARRDDRGRRDRRRARGRPARDRPPAPPRRRRRADPPHDRALRRAARARRRSSTSSGSITPPSEWRALAGAATRALPDCRCLVGSGSLPPGAPAAFLADLVRAARAAGIPSVVDTSGPAPARGRERAGDRAEAEPRRARGDATGETDPVAGARALIVLGAEWVVVSLGAEGMLAVCAGDPVTVLHARLPEPLTGNATGRGRCGGRRGCGGRSPTGRPDPERLLRSSDRVVGRRRAHAARRRDLADASRARRARARRGRAMTLVGHARTIMDAAVAAGTGVGAFNVLHLETAEGLVAGAEAAGLPVILQISQNCAQYHGGLDAIALGTMAVARGGERCRSPCTSITPRTTSSPTRAITSASARSCSTPRAPTTATTSRRPAASRAAPQSRASTSRPSSARSFGKGGAHEPGVRTDPIEAREFVEATGVDALAVAVGSSHAMTERTASLDIDLIGELHDARAGAAGAPRIVRRVGRRSCRTPSAPA